MLECDWAVLCEHAIVAIDGQVSAIGIFDALEAAAFPYQHPVFAVVLRLRGTPGLNVPLRFEVTRPSGDSLHRVDGNFAIPPNGTQYLNTSVTGLTFQETGRYVVKFTTAGEVLRSLSLRVSLMREGAKAARPPSATLH